MHHQVPSLSLVTWIAWPKISHPRGYIQKVSERPRDGQFNKITDDTFCRLRRCSAAQPAGHNQHDRVSGPGGRQPRKRTAGALERRLGRRQRRHSADRRPGRTGRAGACMCFTLISFRITKGALSTLEYLFDISRF